jgi:hypothetical protein
MAVQEDDSIEAKVASVSGTFVDGCTAAAVSLTSAEVDACSSSTNFPIPKGSDVS